VVPKRQSKITADFNIMHRRTRDVAYTYGSAHALVTVWSMESMAAKVGKGLGKGALDALPSELAAEVWGLLDGDEEARRRLMQTSPSVREAFSPVVQSLRVSLASSSSSLLGGLHRGVCVRKLSLVSELDGDQTNVQKEQLQAGLSSLSKRHHFRRVVDLRLKVRTA
jgi:hypothetical protein